MMMLDGSMGTLLCDMASKSFPEELDTKALAKLWSSYFNISHRDTVKLAHTKYLAAGSDYILTNTYQASLKGYLECFPNRSKNDARDFILDGVRIALQAVNDFGPKLKPLVVSLGPYGAYLCNG
jgi:homocysteine S-methyltransferase